MIILVRCALAVALVIAARWGAWEYPAAKPCLLLTLTGYLIAFAVSGAQTHDVVGTRRGN